jgi:hypothetical protein
MDWLTFISNDIKYLAWPIAVIVMVFTLRHEIRSLVRTLGSRLQSLKAFGVETTFGEAVDQVEQLLPAPEVKEISRLEGDAAQRIETISTVAQLPPAYIVSQAWLRLEQALRDALDKDTGPIALHPPSRSRSPLEYLRAAEANGLLTDNEMPAVQRLREMRNLAAHSVDPPISTTDALRYQDMVDALIAEIKRRSNQP